MRVLLTNDDGYSSPLYYLLAEKLKTQSWISELLLVAPFKEQSWIGSAISSHHEVKSELVNINGLEVIAIHGTPADCSTIGCFNIAKEQPDLVISGINLGSNAGTAFTTSSGTLAAARQAAYLGIPGIGLSTIIDKEIRQTWRTQSDLIHTKYTESFLRIANHHLNLLNKVVSGSLYDFCKFGTHYISINTPYEPIDDKLYVTRVKETRYNNFFTESSPGVYKHSFNGFKEHQENVKNELPSDIELLEQHKNTITFLKLDVGDYRPDTKDHF